MLQFPPTIAHPFVRCRSSRQQVDFSCRGLWSQAVVRCQERSRTTKPTHDQTRGLLASREKMFETRFGSQFGQLGSRIWCFTRNTLQERMRLEHVGLVFPSFRCGSRESGQCCQKGLFEETTSTWTIRAGAELAVTTRAAAKTTHAALRVWELARKSEVTSCITCFEV